MHLFITVLWLLAKFSSTFFSEVLTIVFFRCYLNFNPSPTKISDFLMYTASPHGSPKTRRGHPVGQARVFYVHGQWRTQKKSEGGQSFVTIVLRHKST